MLRVGILGLAIMIVVCSVRAQEAEKKASPAARSEFREKVQQALASEHDFDIAEQSLEEVREQLQGMLGLPVLVDRRALEEVGINDDNLKLSLNLKSTSIGTAMRLLLGSHGLTWTVQNEVLLITSVEADTLLALEVFLIEDLVARLPGGEFYTGNLVELITRTIDPNSWDEVGGAGSIVANGPVLVVSQTEIVLDQLRQLLAALRKAREAETQVVDLSSAQGKVFSALEMQTSVNADNVALSEVLKVLAEQNAIAIHLDRAAIQDAGIDVDELMVSLQVTDISLGSVLKLILRPQSLASTIRNNVLVITSSDEVDSDLIVRVYPVADLVQTHNASGVAAARRLGQEETAQSDLARRSRASAREIPSSVRASMGSMFPPQRYDATEIVDPASTPDFDQLIDTITTTIEPVSWEEVGGSGTVRLLESQQLLVVAQSQEAHEGIESLFADLRAVTKKVQEATTEKSPAPDTDEPAANKLVVYRLSYAADEGPSSKELSELIKALVAPESWEQDKTTYLQPMQGVIVVRQTSQAHAEIEKLLLHTAVLTPRVSTMGPISSQTGTAAPDRDRSLGTVQPSGPGEQ